MLMPKHKHTQDFAPNTTRPVAMYKPTLLVMVSKLVQQRTNPQKLSCTGEEKIIDC